MPDSQLPPLWGPAYDERDLDALLSGETRGTPVALRPVEGALAALRAAPTRRELSDEAVARAAFRAFAPKPSPTVPQPWGAGAEPAAVPSHALVLPPADGRPRPAARHRHRRPAARSARKPRLALTSAAAALVVVAAVVTGTLTGSIGELTSFGRQPAGSSASAHATGHSPASQSPMGTGTAGQPSPKPTASAITAPTATPRPTSSAGTLCLEYFEDSQHPGPGDQAAMNSLHGQLSKLAGGSGPGKIFEYCLRYLNNPLDGKGEWPPAGTSDGAPSAAPTGASSPASSGGDGPSGSADTGSAGGGSEANQPGGTSGQSQSGSDSAP